MSARLSPPDEMLAKKILATVPYKDRIPAGRLTPRMGITRGSVRGLPELHLYLTPDARTLPGINLDRLADWIEQVIMDKEFAEEVRSATRAAGSYVDGCMKVYEIVGLRLDQANDTLGRRANGAPTGEESYYENIHQSHHRSFCLAGRGVGSEADGNNGRSGVHRRAPL